MTNRQLVPGPRRSALLGLLAVWLLTAGGCAQMGFPEWPPIAQNSPAAEEAEEGDPADADPAVAEATEPEPEPEPEPGKLYDWTGDGREVTRIVIDTDTQRANFYAGSERVGWTTIATGVSTHPTPRGQFSILEKVRDKRSNLYGKLVRNGKVIRSNAHGRDPVPRGARFVGASMPHFMRLTYDGIGMHAGPIPNPGQPASHGCIRMPPEMAQAVFAHVGPNTAVTVVGNGPDYGNYAERIARQRAEERARRQAAERARRAEAAAAAASAPRNTPAAEVATAGPAAAEPRDAADNVPATDQAQPGGDVEAQAGADAEPENTPQGQAAPDAPDAPESERSAAARIEGTAASAGNDTPAEAPADTEARPSRGGGGPADSDQTSTEASAAAPPTRQTGGGQPAQRAGPDAEAPAAPERPAPEPVQPAEPQPRPPVPAPTIRAAGDEPVPAPQI